MANASFEKMDMAADKKAGIKENSPTDLKLDAKSEGGSVHHKAVSVTAATPQKIAATLHGKTKK